MWDQPIHFPCQTVFHLFLAACIPAASGFPIVHPNDYVSWSSLVLRAAPKWQLFDALRPFNVLKIKVAWIIY
ncbi:hypothetical protein BJ912DRAFT_991728, partial [Pholiota molesta]